MASPSDARSRGTLPKARWAARLGALLAVAAAGASVASACTDDATTAPAVDGGEDELGASELEGCPKTEPASGSACLVPEGTTCDFGQCGTRLGRCMGGAWVFGANPPPRPPCPDPAPNPGVLCPPCWPPAATCPYGGSDCTPADASLVPGIASCPNGTWVFELRSCPDAGPDVQGDGGPAAD